MVIQSQPISHLADDEDISQPGGEHVTIAILDVDNVERSLMSLPKIMHFRILINLKLC